MRIAVSNPDNIGDFILRQPMLAAFLEAGHEVLLIVRDFVAPLAIDLFPQARILRCAGNPYEREFGLESPIHQEFLQIVRTFDPELLVVASYQYTQLEELLAKSLPKVHCIGFTGHLFQSRPEVTIVSEIQFAVRVAAPRDIPELEKNELLCGAVLGHEVRLGRPRMETRPQSIETAQAILGKLGLDGQRFWAVCAGDIPEKSVKNWHRSQWAEFCKGLLAKQDAHLLFIGSPDEHEATLAIQTEMGAAGLRTATITEMSTTLQTLTAILHLADGYIGKDTGPMHIAAALGKPVLAVFGGGHWPRFVPAAVSGAAFTVNVPCTGCDWSCHLSRSHCVKDIPVATVLEAAEKMLRGELQDFRVEVIQPDRVLAASILREFWESAQTVQRKAAEERGNFMQWHEDRMRDIGELRNELDAVKTEKEQVQAQAVADRQTRELRREQLNAVEESARKREEVSTTLEFECRLAVANMRQAIEDRAAVERRLERFRHHAIRKIAEARVKAAGASRELEALRNANASLEFTAGQAMRENGEWKAKWENATEQLEEKTIQAAVLQMQVDTGDSRYQGLLSDQEQLLKRKSVELASALALIPDLREELAAQSADLALREERIGQLERSLETRERLIAQLEVRGAEAERDRESTQKLLALTGRDFQVMAEDHAARLVVIESLVKELAHASEDRAAKQMLIDSLTRQLEVSDADRQRRLEVIEDLSARLTESEQDRGERLRVIEDLSGRLAESEQDRAERLLLIQRLSADLATIDADRADRGEQIAKLHEDIARLMVEITELRSLLPYRILKRLRIV